MNPKPEAWTLTSELEGERASSFRQGRWCRVLIESGFTVVSFNIRGALGLSRSQFRNVAELDEFQASVRANARPMASVREGVVIRAIRHIKHLLLADLWLPNVWLLVASLLRQLRGTDPDSRVVLMASSPPFSVALAAALVKAIYPRRFELVVDMRDAWAHHTGLGGIRLLKRWIERRVLRRADHVFTVSHGLSREFNESHGVQVRVLYNVATHYFNVPDPESVDWSVLNSSIRPGSKKFVYTGSTPEGHFDLLSIVTGVKRAVAGGVTADRLQLIFIGACAALAREVIRQGGCADVVVFVPHQPHRVAQQIQQQAEGLVFLAYNGEGNKGVVSTKFFEYLALAKPVLPFSIRRGSDVDDLLIRFTGCTLRLLDADEITDALRSLNEERLALPRCADPSALSVLLQDYRNNAVNLLQRVVAK